MKEQQTQRARQRYQRQPQQKPTHKVIKAIAWLMYSAAIFVALIDKRLYLYMWQLDYWQYFTFYALLFCMFAVGAWQFYKFID